MFFVVASKLCNFGEFGFFFEFFGVGSSNSDMSVVRVQTVFGWVWIKKPNLDLPKLEGLKI